MRDQHHDQYGRDVLAIRTKVTDVIFAAEKVVHYRTLLQHLDDVDGSEKGDETARVEMLVRDLLDAARDACDDAVWDARRILPGTVTVDIEDRRVEYREESVPDDATYAEIEATVQARTLPNGVPSDVGELADTYRWSPTNEETEAEAETDG